MEPKALSHMIIQYILFLLTLLLGYYLGTKRNVLSDLSTFKKNTQKEIRKLTREELKVGAIRRPTNEQIQSQNMPEEKKAALKAMEETLKNIPELNI